MDSYQSSSSATVNRTQDARQYCIKTCIDCFQVCTEAIKRCLSLGGHHANPLHIALMQTCVRICQTNAEILMLGSKMELSCCESCAEICEICAEECSNMKGLEDCENACITCAGNCRKISNR